MLMESLESYIELSLQDDCMETIMVHFRFPQAVGVVCRGEKNKKNKNAMMMATNR
jgi:hypothetical protein